ncbi:MAG: hypothetical protein JXQ23_08610 [Clostridia bacterium]|nr:hypothetical protein [Clostridia bacterium]
MADRVSENYMKELETTLKIGLVATIGEDGKSHITVLSTIQANTPEQMIVGQFTEGISKSNFKLNDKTGFLIMNLQKQFFMGKMNWTHEKKEGPEYVMYNQQPMYRYNTYFGIHTVHFFNLKEISEKRDLDMKGIILNAMKTMAGKNLFRKRPKETIMKPWAQTMMSKLDTLKFISFIDENGYPIIVPVIQAQAASSGTIAFSDKPYTEYLNKIKAGTPVCMLGMNLDLENVLVKGTFRGFKRTIAGKMGSMDIDQVYNSMPPKPRYVYPYKKAEAVKDIF